MKNCEKYGSLGDLQDGFRKGRSTTRTLLHNELVNDYNKRLRIDNYVGMTDISGCFDRILPPIISLLNRKNGCPKQAVKMHADTLRNAKDFYSNLTTPVYGNGQGAGDSPSQWSQESALLFQLYQETMTGTKMCNRYGDEQVNIPLAAFADDTNLLGNTCNPEDRKNELTQNAKAAFSTWNRYLHAAGHFMELPKCSCYLHFWNFQDDGYAFTEDPTSHLQEIKVKDNEGELQTIPQLKSNHSQKLLGVMKNPMGDQQDEIARLKQKSDNIAKRINTNKMTRAEAKLAYEAFYIPAVRYSLNITSINQMDMESIQSKAVLAFLVAQGFNRHMPREVVFAPTLYQGLGLRHMYDMQGTDSTRLLIQELNQEGSMTQKMLLSSLDTIQLEAGIGKPILENCKALAYIEWGWIPQIRDFLWHINGQIIGATETPKIYRENDQYLMDSPIIEKLPRRDQIYIHRCRLHLQVETLSDITTSDGQHINEVWRHANTDKPSVSNVRWPRQNSPQKAVWKVWSKFLDSFCTTKNKLRIQLGNWHTNNPSRTHQAYFVQDQKDLWIQQDNTWNRHEMISQKRSYWLFNPSTSTTTAHRPENGTPIDITTQTDIYIKTLPTSPLRQNSNNTVENTTWYQQHNRDFHNITGKVDLLADPEDYPALFEQKAYIDIASDGGHEPTSGISTFGWVVAVNKSPIAKGRGAAEAHPLLAESFRA
jgi:hypothetical protein